MVKLIWIGAVCCGIANGLICSFVSAPAKYFFMLCVVLICVLLVLCHYHRTKEWLKDSDFDDCHYPIFTVSTIVLAILAVVSLFFSFEIFIGVATSFVTFVFLTIREVDYAWKIRGLFILKGLPFKIKKFNETKK